MSVHRFVLPDPEQAGAACAHQILAHLETALQANNTASLAISGGSSPKAIFRELVAAQFDWARVHVFFVDERCVPPTHEQSNYRMADQHFLIPARVPHRNAHRVYTELRPDRAAERYAEDIREALGLAYGEIPSFDVIHLGMGPDGHTASLFPGEPLIEDRDAIAAAVYVERLAQYRVTLLPAVILNARHTVVYSPGADKAEAIRTALETDYDPVRMPMQLVRHGRYVGWFMDEPAAANLS